MAFNANNLTLWSIPSTSRLFGLPQWWGYLTTDTMATVEANYYFNLGNGLKIPVGGNSTWFVGDLIYCVCSDGVVQLQIASLAIDGSLVITSAAVTDIPSGSITTAMLANLAVTAAKIAANTITTSQISGTAGILGSQLSSTAGIAGSQLANNTITTNQLALSVPQVLRVPITSAAFKTAFTAGLPILPAPGAGLAIIVEGVTYSVNFSTAQYTAGGAVSMQYSAAAPVNANGIAADVTLPAATVNGVTANSIVKILGALAINTQAAVVNMPVWLTVATANFATGAGSIVANIRYHVVTV